MASLKPQELKSAFQTSRRHHGTSLLLPDYPAHLEPVALTKLFNPLDQKGYAWNFRSSSITRLRLPEGDFLLFILVMVLDISEGNNIRFIPIWTHSQDSVSTGRLQTEKLRRAVSDIFPSATDTLSQSHCG